MTRGWIRAELVGFSAGVFQAFVNGELHWVDTHLDNLTLCGLPASAVASSARYLCGDPSRCYVCDQLVDLIQDQWARRSCPLVTGRLPG